MPDTYSARCSVFYCYYSNSPFWIKCLFLFLDFVKYISPQKMLLIMCDIFIYVFFFSFMISDWSNLQSEKYDISNLVTISAQWTCSTAMITKGFGADVIHTSGLTSGSCRLLSSVEWIPLESNWCKPLGLVKGRVSSGNGTVAGGQTRSQQGCFGLIKD